MDAEAQALVEALRRKPHDLSHQAADTIERLSADLGRAREALTRINAKLGPDYSRTFDDLIADAYWAACEARAALASNGDEE